MGMFDYVECSYPLEAPELNQLKFQTKSLARRLDKYLITESGRLLIRPWRYDDKTEQPTLQLAQPTDFTGVVEFYCYVRTNDSHVYKATFFNGWLTDLEVTR
jgi:hypothetical protein